MLKKLLTISLFTFSLSTSVFASAPQEDSIKQAIELSHVSEILTKTIDVTNATFHEQATQRVKRRTGHTELTAQDIEAVDKISKIMSQSLSNMMQTINITQLTENAFRKYYTEEELQVYIKFLSSPEGQSINKKSPLLIQDVMKTFSDTLQNNTGLQTQLKSSDNEIKSIISSLPKAENQKK